MTFRTKLLISFSGLILLMAVVFYSIAHGYLMVMFRTYANNAEQRQAGQWAQLLAYHYQSEHNSWAGTEPLIAGILAQAQEDGTPDVERITITTAGHQVISVSDDRTDTVTKQEEEMDSASATISVSGRKVGIVNVIDERQQGLFVVAERILKWMTWTTLIGVGSASAVAFLIALLLTRRISGPLNNLLGAMERIVGGNSKARVHIPGTDEFARVGSAFNLMTERWLKTDEARKRLVADVAHELRTPLSVMQGHLELVQEGMDVLDHGMVLRLLDEVMRLSRLVDDLHRLSLAEAGVLKLDCNPTDLGRLIQRVVDNFNWEAEDKQIHIDLRLPFEPAVAIIDAHRMTQVIVNLVGNALRYTPELGCVAISLEGTEGAWLLNISDTGRGIPEADLPHVFDRFYRVHEERSRETGGMGIGLAIAQEYVYLHNGQIKVDSEVGRGTTFTVILPKAF